MTAFEKELLDFSTTFPKDLQRKINTLISRKDDEKGEFIHWLIKFAEDNYPGGAEEFLDAWWKEMVRRGVGAGLGLKVPSSKPWRETERIDVFNDAMEIGNEVEMLKTMPMTDKLNIIYFVYLRHDYCAQVLWDTLLKEFGRDEFEKWIDSLLKENGLSVVSISKATGTSGELGTLLDEIFEVYDANGLFFPVEVEGGRKFQGLGYVLSQRQTNYSFSGHHVSATTYSAWDPIGRRTVEFNCKYNLMYYSKHPEERIDMEGYELDLDISDEERASAFKAYFTDLVSRAKAKCGSDYRYMKNYINVCTNRIIPWELLDRIVEIMGKKDIVSENRKVDSTSLRAYTNALIEDAEEGLLSWEEIARAALSYMSEDDVRDMAQDNFDFEDEDEYDDINESRKTTLTFNQLRKIIGESR